MLLFLKLHPVETSCWELGNIPNVRISYHLGRKITIHIQAPPSSQVTLLRPWRGVVVMHRAGYSPITLLVLLPLIFIVLLTASEKK